MTISLKCPGCGKALKVKEDFPGKKGKCPGCGAVLLVPEPSSQPQEPLPQRRPSVLRSARLWIVAAAIAVGMLVAVFVLSIAGPEPIHRQQEESGSVQAPREVKRPAPSDRSSTNRASTAVSGAGSPLAGGRPQVLRAAVAVPDVVVSPRAPAMNDTSSPGTVRWKCQPTAEPEEVSPVAVAPDGTAFAVVDGTLYAVTPEGKVKWHQLLHRHPTTGTASFFSCPSVGADGTVYVSCHAGYVYAVGSDGKQKWVFESPWAGGRDLQSALNQMLTGVCLGADGTVYVCDWAGVLRAIAQDGRTKWSFQASHRFISDGCVVGPSEHIYAANMHGLFAVSDDGTQKWVVRNGIGQGIPEIKGAPKGVAALWRDGTAYISTYTSADDGGRIYGISPEGKVVWESAPLGAGGSTSSVSLGPHGKIYVVVAPGGANSDTDSRLVAIMPRNGKEEWSFRLGGTKSTPAVGSDGTIYVGSAAGKLLAAGAEGKLAWEIALDGQIRTSPAIGADGVVFITTSAGTLYAINTGSKGPARSPWPMYMRDAQRSGRASQH